MPYPMLHLLTAHQALQERPEIEDPTAFILGNFAPDAVHFREPYSPNDKLVTHLYPFARNWGEMSNIVDSEGEHEQWAQAVLAWYERPHLEAPRDFLRGYALHLLADIVWSLRIYEPLMHGTDPAQGAALDREERDDCVEWENRFWKALHEEETLWSAIREGQAYGLEGLMSREELQRMQHSLIHDQYAHREVRPDHVFRHVQHARVDAALEETGRRADVLFR